MALDQDFSIFALLTFWTKEFFLGRGYPVYFRMFTSNPGLQRCQEHPISITTIKNVPRYCQMSYEDQNRFKDDCFSSQLKTPILYRNKEWRLPGAGETGNCLMGIENVLQVEKVL